MWAWTAWAEEENSVVVERRRRKGGQPFYSVAE